MAEIKADTREAKCPAVEANITVDCRGETCPVPEVLGTHPASKKEIPMAVEALKLKLLSVEGADTDWTIRIRR